MLILADQNCRSKAKLEYYTQPSDSPCKIDTLYLRRLECDHSKVNMSWPDLRHLQDGLHHEKSQLTLDFGYVRLVVWIYHQITYEVLGLVIRPWGPRVMLRFYQVNVLPDFHF